MTSWSPTMGGEQELKKKKKRKKIDDNLKNLKRKRGNMNKWHRNNREVVGEIVRESTLIETAHPGQAP